MKRSCACQVAGGFTSVRSASALVDVGNQGRNNRPGDFILNSEDVLQLSVVMGHPHFPALVGLAALVAGR